MSNIVSWNLYNVWNNCILHEKSADFRRGIALAYLNGPVYAVGGLDDMACFNIVERYDPDSDTWTAVQNMTYARGGVAVAAFRVIIYTF